MASVASNTTKAIRTVRGDNLATAVTLSSYAQSRAAGQTHAGLQCQKPTVKLCGEILGWVETNDPATAVTEVVRLWLKSPRHRTMLLDRSWRWFGVGVTRKDGKYLFAVEFAK